MPGHFRPFYALTTRRTVRPPAGVVDIQTGEVITESPTTNGTMTATTAVEPETPRLAAIPDYPIDALPEPMRILVQCGVQDGLSAALVAGAALAAVASAIGSNATLEVRPGRWLERANLWVSLMAPRGAGKSPAQALAFAPMRDRDAAGWTAYKEEVKRWRASKERDDQPVDSSVLFSDTNFEALVRRLDSTTDGAAAWEVDELSKLLRGLGEYKAGGGGDRGRFLELWEGAPWRYTRVGGGGRTTNGIDILIPKPTVSICGGI